MPQYLPLGTVSTPATWTLPAGLELAVGSVFASFDGTSAAGAYIPTLQVISDAGATVVEVPQDASVAAGSSVVASWAPFLRGQAAATTTATGVPFASATYSNAAFADTGFARSNVSVTAGSFITSDTTVFGTATSGGVLGLQLKVAGEYLVTASIFGQANAAPAAGSFVQAYTASVNNRIVDEARVGGWFLIDSFGDYQAAAARQLIAVVQPPASPAPETILLSIGQNSGLSVQVDAYLTAVQLTTGTI